MLFDDGILRYPALKDNRQIPPISAHKETIDLTFMSNKMCRIFSILSVLVLVSCSESLDIQLEPEVHVFLSNDSDQRIPLTPRDKEYTVLNEWLSEHRSSWHPTSGHYPGGVYIKSGSFGIQVTEMHVVLYSAARPEPTAMYIQKVGKGELSEIRSIGK